jgi:hypothetical protein
MHIIHLTDATIAAGKSAFNSYRAAVMCGPSAAAYVPGLRRQTGLAVMPGAILACIEQGMITEDEILNGVARLSRCRRSMVLSVLIGLRGGDPEVHLWRADRTGNYHVLTQSVPKVALAA